MTASQMTASWTIEPGPVFVAQAGNAELAVRTVGGHPRFTVRQPAGQGPAQRFVLVASGTAASVETAMKAAERACRLQASAPFRL